MRRAFTKKTALPIFIALVAIMFVVPQGTHAGAVADAAAKVTGTFFDITLTSLSHMLSLSFEFFILPVASALLALAGLVMDKTIEFSLHTAYIFSLSPAINLGWSIIRDIANIFFIFILIYISLGTIVNGLRFGTMNMLKNVVIAAMLINFSLFFTKALVDVSNVFGNWLYNGIQLTLQANANGPISPSVSDLVSERLGIVQWWKLGDTNTAANNGASGSLSDFLTNPSKGFIGVMLRLAIELIAIYIFIYAAVLFLSRSVTILFLLVFAPVGFMGNVLPQIKDYSKEWWSELSKAATFPVVFLLMLYISIQFINSLGVLDIASLKDNTISISSYLGGISISTYFQYFLIIFLLKASLAVAKKYSGGIGDMLGGFAESIGKLAVNAIGTYATGGAMTALRAGGRGLGAAWSAEKGKGMEAFRKTALENVHPTVAGLFTGEGKLSKYIKVAREEGSAAALRKAGSELKDTTAGKMKSGTWDVRNINVGGTKVSDMLSSTVGSATKAKIDLKGKDAKEIKTEQAEWAEEKKIEKANQEILKHLETLGRQEIEATLRLKDGSEGTLRKFKEDAEKAPKGDAGDKARKNYTEALRVYGEIDKVKTAREGIATEASKLGNRQVEKVDKKAQKNSEFLRAVSKGQVKQLVEKAESDDDKAKVWQGRTSGISDLVKNGADAKDIKNAVKAYSDEELRNLPADVLANPLLIGPDAMDYDKFDKITKAENLTGATVQKMKSVRYAQTYEDLWSGDAKKIEDALKKLEPIEIAKLGWEKDQKDPKTGAVTRKDAPVLSDPQIALRLDTKTLRKVYEEAGSDDMDHLRALRAAVLSKGQYKTNNNGDETDQFEITNGAGMTAEVERRVIAAAKFFKSDSIGKEFGV